MRDINGMSPFHHAAQSENADCLGILIDKKIKLNMKDCWDREPIHVAAQRGHTEAIKKILDTDSWSLSTDKLGGNPVQYLVDFGVDTQVKISAVPSAPDATGGPSGNSDTRTTQSQPVIKHQKILDIIVEIAQHKPDWKDPDQRTFLHYAAQYIPTENCVEIVKSLMKHGCDPTLEDKDGRTVLHRALLSNNLPVTMHFLDSEDGTLDKIAKSGELVLEAACRGGCEPAVTKILKIWPDLDINKADDKYGQSPLSWACERKHNGVVQVLLDNDRTNLNQSADKWRGYTPLHICVIEKNNEGLALLLAKPARVNIKLRHEGGRTALDVAIGRSNAEATKMLLSHAQTSDQDRIVYLEKMIRSEDPNLHGIIPDVFQQVAMDSLTHEVASDFIAASQTFKIQALYDAVMLKVLESNEIVCPYHVAIQANDADAIAKFLEKGVNTTSVDEDGWSLGYYADRFGRSYLLDGLSSQDSRVQTPLSYPTPGELLWPDGDDNVSITSCGTIGHDSCAGITSKFNPNVPLIVVFRAMLILFTQTFKSKGT